MRILSQLGRCVIAAFGTSMLVLVLAGCEPRTNDVSDSSHASTSLESSGFIGPAACAECHQSIHASCRETAHYRDSTKGASNSVLGPLATRNRLPTSADGVDLVIEQFDGVLLQSITRRTEAGDRRLRSESFDIVIGCTKGQTAAYWGRDGVLRQLPASYVARIDKWIYSPGYPFGQASFARELGAGCLECHATYVGVSDDELVRKSQPLILGITCEKCHGPGREHADYRRRARAASGDPIIRISSLSRDRQIDVCGLCHSGATMTARFRLPFTFRPGETLADYYEFDPQIQSEESDGHSNQVSLLRSSRCFQESETMTCSTCHDVHSVETGKRTRFADRCLACHEEVDCGGRERVGQRFHELCIDCHMPVRDSPTLEFTVDERGSTIHMGVRSHLITISK